MKSKIEGNFLSLKKSPVEPTQIDSEEKIIDKIVDKFFQK